ncbi:MAG: hypothetical protein ASARMPREDX12_005212 [Alectoria sarmentosa]|nr:MAG: hypothetical protein ASARMPREDX12_005212 [Alectoria sarmentosa]
MMGKRKRDRLFDGNPKRTKVEEKTITPVKHPALGLYYRNILTLRDYLLSKLPITSKARRRKIVSIVSDTADFHHKAEETIHEQTPRPDSSRTKELEAFSQHVSPTAGSSVGGSTTSLSDLVDFAVWLLFHKNHRHAHRPPHMLCHGFQRASNPRQTNEDHCAIAGIPGIVSHYPNANVHALKGSSWTEILGLLGREGDRIMLDLVLDCGIFMAGDEGLDIGTPLTELHALRASNFRTEATDSKPELCNTSAACLVSQSKPKNPAAITFVRSRMFYARAALNAKGRVTFGLRHIHVLNRYSDDGKIEHTIHIMKYVFPRQFGMHNVFTRTVDSKESVQPFKDYTLREQEITDLKRQNLTKGKAGASSIAVKQQLPKRLRGEALDLVRKLQRLHSRCSYYDLLKHYCPIKRTGPLPKRMAIAEPADLTPEQLDSQVLGSSSYSSIDAAVPQLRAEPPKAHLVSLATPHSDVSAFCQAVLSNLIPSRFWGEGTQGQENKNVVMRNVDRFVKLRRFENLSLHAVFQGLKLTPMTWLTPAQVNPSLKVAASDVQKRKEILLEFIYYVFDSLLIPLIRSNFHVTESNVHQNHLFFFRHDVWRMLTEPALANFKLSMYEEIKTVKAQRLLDARALGFSQIRLLPKSNGVRPITNLRRRVTKLQNGKVTLGRSINSVMLPVFNVLEFEKRKQPALVGSALFSVGDMYPKLKTFAQTLQRHKPPPGSYYFAKVDAKSCFDTIPQQEMVRLIKQIASEEDYRIARHAEIKPSETHDYGIARNSIDTKPARKFISTARAATDFQNFDEFVSGGLGTAKKNTVFVNSIVETLQTKEKTLDLLQDHVERNVVKIGKKFFRQKAGIPQGSILSSLLCNYFYAELERESLGFLEGDESLLLRLIDDFLLITTNKDHAKKFLQVMHDGVEKYGVEVNPAKSLTNFDVIINGSQVPCLRERIEFPYCGDLINTKTLEITKDRDRRKSTVLANTLTVEPSRVPGKAFYRKALNALKIQMHKMFLDTSFNSPVTVLSTIYQNFVEVAMKYYRYAKCMQGGKHPHLDLLIAKERLGENYAGTIQDLVELALVLIKGKHKGQTEQGYICTVSKCQVEWLAAKAFRNILAKKQSKYGHVILWLDDAIWRTKPNSAKDMSRLNRVVNEGDAVFLDYKF